MIQPSAFRLSPADLARLLPANAVPRRQLHHARGHDPRRSEHRPEDGRRTPLILHSPLPARGRSLQPPTEKGVCAAARRRAVGSRETGKKGTLRVARNLSHCANARNLGSFCKKAPVALLNRIIIPQSPNSCRLASAQSKIDGEYFITLRWVHFRQRGVADIQPNENDMRSSVFAVSCRARH